MDKLVNFHTHTYLCRHATGTVQDYCDEAIRQNIGILGFSDHTPYPDGRWESSRMTISELDGYVNAVRKARDDNSDKLTVLLGMECEYVPDMISFFKDEMRGRCGLDYLIGSAHSYTMDGQWQSLWEDELNDRQLHAYTDYVVEGINSGLYIFWCHPDMFGGRYRGWNQESASCCREICRAAVSAGLPLEINAYGLRKKTVIDHGVERRMYPLRKFWEIAGEEGVEAVVSSDAHKAEDVWGNTGDCLEWAAQYGVSVVNERLASLLTGRDFTEA